MVCLYFVPNILGLNNLRPNFPKISVLSPSAMQAPDFNNLQTRIIDVMHLLVALLHYSLQRRLEYH